MNIPSIFWIVPAASVVALAFAWLFYSLMKREDEGTPRMREIAAHVLRILRYKQAQGWIE